jgi:hypothetical protein
MNRSLSLCALVLMCATGLLVASISLIATPGTLAATTLTSGEPAVALATHKEHVPYCSRQPFRCVDSQYDKDAYGNYVGHDEPSLLFYSDVPGSGNSNSYQLTLPTDPPTLPKEDGTGGTFSFELHPAFWFGMAMCDSQSDPEYSHVCTPNTDDNIFNSFDPTSAHWIGHHPGVAFMEMQFYPPGWVPWPPGVSCDTTKWCAALNIDSYEQNEATLAYNNDACREVVGDEPVNFAFITKNGLSQAPANAVSFETNPAVSTPDLSKDLLMNSGDKLRVDMHDTPDGFTVIIHDVTSGGDGSMTASIANGFGQIKFQPNGNGCTVLPYAFHPMYSTSSPQTRVTWAAHSYNVAFSDEIGHFELCKKVDQPGGNCTGGGDRDNDDGYCFDKSWSLLIKVGGCLGADSDWDGPSYQLDWPGILPNHNRDMLVHPTSMTFPSPTFTSTDGPANYSRVAFETDLPPLERAFHSNNCNRSTGKWCTNPPPGAQFYPIYSTNTANAQCVWQLGGTHIPGTNNTFGGNSTAEYGSIIALTYQNRMSSERAFEDYRQILKNNPCPTNLP